MKNCQHCGLELASKRAKNCPTCRDLLQTANRYGTYSFVMEAIQIAKDAEMTGEEMHQAMDEAMNAGTQERNRIADEIRARAKAKKEQHSKDVAYYHEHGYWPWQAEEHPDNIENDVIENVASRQDALHPFED